MNLREGTRRLALLLGVAGTILGGFASYMELQTVFEQRTRHNRFEQLAASDVVQQERKNLQTEPNDWQTVPVDKWAKYAVKSEHTPQKSYLDPKTGEPIQIDARTGNGIEIDPKTGQSFEIDPKTGERIQAAPDFIPDTSQKHGPWEKYADKGKSGAVLDMSKSIPIPSVVMKNGIKAVNWNHDYGVESIETEDGQTLYPTLAPSAWLYLLIVLFPVLGFFIPWGTIRALGWVGAGFVQPAK